MTWNAIFEREYTQRGGEWRAVLVAENLGKEPVYVCVARAGDLKERLPKFRFKRDRGPPTVRKDDRTLLHKIPRRPNDTSCVRFPTIGSRRILFAEPLGTQRVGVVERGGICRKIHDFGWLLACAWRQQ